jgi:hypothetical protein
MTFRCIEKNFHETLDFSHTTETIDSDTKENIDSSLHFIFANSHAFGNIN